MFIQTESTPNPASLKFLPGRIVLGSGTAEYRNPDEAAGSPPAERLFGVGGVITFQGFRDGVVFLNMRGSCAGCPSSTATLKHGIQNLLRHFVPEVREIQEVAG